MSRLFLRIFLWFWLGSTVLFLVLAVSLILSQPDVITTWRFIGRSAMQYVGSHVADVYEQDGASAAATVESEDDTLVQVCWRGRQRTLYFQDGPYFWVRPDANVTVVATYPNGTIAALVTGFGAGRVGVVGPHPEATSDWYADAGLAATGRLGADLGLDLVDAVMGSGHRS